jgi:hypothetical protein
MVNGAKSPKGPRRGKRNTPLRSEAMKKTFRNKLLTPAMQYPIWRGYLTPTTKESKQRIPTRSYSAKLDAGPKGKLHRRFRAEKEARESFLPAVKRFRKQSMELQAGCIKLMTTPLRRNKPQTRLLRLGSASLAKRAAYAGAVPYAYAWNKSTKALKPTYRMVPSYAIRAASGTPKLYKLKKDKAKLKAYVKVKRDVLDKKLTQAKQAEAVANAELRNVVNVAKTAARNVAELFGGSGVRASGSSGPAAIREVGAVAAAAAIREVGAVAAAAQGRPKRASRPPPRFVP